MWIKFSAYSLSTRFSSNSLNVLLVRPKLNTWVISWGKDGVRVDPKNIEAMKDWPHPKTLKILRGFLGLIGYYRKFVKNYGKIVAPLMALLKNNSFNWTPVAAQAFQTLKMAMCTTPVLDLPDFTKTFVLVCNASRKGIGVVLM
jgi:hypothetical protein